MSVWARITGHGPLEGFNNRNSDFALAVLISIGLATAFAAAVPVAALAQDPEGRLGLSASPTAYVAELETNIGEPFTLYAILTGPDDQTPLAFDLYWVEWAVFTACCSASPVAVTAIDYVDGVVAREIGEDGVIELYALDCLDGEVITIATLTFEWLLEGETSFPVSAGPISAALDCDDGVHMISSLLVDIIGVGEPPSQSTTWSSVKEDYRQ